MGNGGTAGPSGLLTQRDTLQVQVRPLASLPIEALGLSEGASRADIPAALLADSARTLFTPHLGSAVVSVRRAIDMTACENVVDVLVRGVAPRGAVNAPLSVDHGTAT